MEHFKLWLKLVLLTGFGSFWLITCDSSVHLPSENPTGNPCFNLQDYLHVVSIIKIPGETYSVAATNQNIWVTGGSYGVQVIDATDPANPLTRGAISTIGTVRAMASSGELIFTACGEAGLVIIDISNPDAPRVVGSEDTPGSAGGIAVNGAEVYVTDDIIGLIIFDVSDPSSPVSAGIENTPGLARDVTVSGTLAYVADEQLGIRVVDVSNIISPVLINTVTTPGVAQGIASAGNYVFVSDGNAGLQVIDASVLGSESIVGSLDPPGSANDVFVSGRYAIVAGNSGGLHVIDVSTPTDPVKINSLPSSSKCLGITKEGDYICTAEGSSGIRFMEAGNVYPPPTIDNLKPNSQSQIKYIDAANDSVFGIDLSPGGGIFAARLAADQRFELIGTGSIYILASDLIYYRDYIYVTSGNRAVHIYDAHDPLAISFEKFVAVNGGGNRLDIHGDYLYIAGGDDYISIYRLGSQDTPSCTRVIGLTITAVAADSNHAFVTGTGELAVVNVENEAIPVVEQRVPIDGTGEDILLRDGLAFIAVSAGSGGSRNGVAVYSVSEPLNPTLLQFCETSTGANRIALGENTIYAILSTRGIEVIDASNLLDLKLIGYIKTDRPAVDLSVSNKTLYFADQDSGLVAMKTQECVRR